MYNRRFTPERITNLAENEIFVFGSNLAGAHGGGAARTALEHFGAVWGVGVGLQGQSYAIPTMQGGLDAIRPYVDQFIEFAAAHREYTFLVTRIGCGIAAFSAGDIAPLFAKAIELENIILPKDFVDVIQSTQDKPDTAIWTADSRADFMDRYASLMQKVKNGDKSCYYRIKEMRAGIFQNTIALVNQGFYITESGRKIVLDNDRMFSGTKFYSRQFDVYDIPAINGRTTVEVVETDCMLEGIRLLDEGYRPAVLNMANRRTPGGGVLNGAGAQEETIFRRTNIFRSLYQFAPFAGDYGVRRSALQYPMHEPPGSESQRDDRRPLARAHPPQDPHHPAHRPGSRPRLPGARSPRMRRLPQSPSSDSPPLPRSPHGKGVRRQIPAHLLRHPRGPQLPQRPQPRGQLPAFQAGVRG